MIRIPYKVLTFTCEPENALFLPTFKGSSFRGVFGRTLKKALCTLKTQKDCNDCPLLHLCYYAYIFETIPQRDSSLPFGFHKLPSVPHPFVLEPPEHEKKIFVKGEDFTFSLILIGKATDFEPLFVLAVKLAGEHGIGKGNRQFILKTYQTNSSFIEVNLSNHHEDHVNDTILTLKFTTPLRLIYQGRLVKNLEFHHLFRALLRRITSLYYFHVEKKFLDIDVSKWIKLAINVRKIQDHLSWMDFERYSYRQARRMVFGGLTGEVTFEGKLQPFISLLKAGEVLHCGKNTSFGLGKYSLT
ncbi:MAG: CRISPR system precrRNA processing endoribonuclease RAMP protein Cas6 [Candidatus Kryptonium sp.]